MIDEDKAEELEKEEDSDGDDDAVACDAYEALLVEANELAITIRGLCADIASQVEDAPDDDADDMAGHLDEIQAVLRSIAGECIDLATRICKAL